MEYSQSALVEGIKAKDVAAYNYMINKYTKTIYYLAYNILSPALGKEDIEECVSDVFLDAWIKIDEFNQEKGNFRTWLFILTKYKALTYKRKKATKNVVDIEEFQIKDSYNLEKQFFLRQDQEKVVEIINSFNRIDKEIFFRRYFFDEKISDLEKTFNLSRSAIDNRLLRGRKIIKEALNYE
ncbi:sigma-70 family RNA polymerase sigma factor [Geosporobacter ferrireducens]|uniref:RNA polymerase subunit sigma-24 n=1 Tax=Geosporobacter ferrireducens TaxID=1424294 RepID=A0A1D8GI94_9FIRM|nr:sigma-70 family RNA polymerase sigma factor [Geosporobacter ferrireducens]AOT70636.1 RNA polymerase subunit sigma-24 [Geosporobacter ferrireducens]MTI57432.1 sigma-70 family RNA polymerase sigma factor [Geosporobacter ferrireducens]